MTHSKPFIDGRSAYAVATFHKEFIQALAEAPEHKERLFLTEFNGRWIGRDELLPEETEKVYYKQFSLVTPRWHNPENVAEELAKAQDVEAVTRFECKQTDIFTRKTSSQISDFPEDEIDEQVKYFSQKYQIPFIKEALGKEFLPF